jgi:hypothetical protein
MFRSRGSRFAPSLAEHSLPRLREAGMIVTLNTDIPVMTGTPLTREYAQVFGYDNEILAELGVAASFAPADCKARLREEIEAWLGGLPRRVCRRPGVADSALSWAQHRHLPAFPERRLLSQLGRLSWRSRWSSLPAVGRPSLISGHGGVDPVIRARLSTTMGTSVGVITAPANAPAPGVRVQVSGL